MSELAGACLCGAVEVKVSPKNREIGTCHCTMCRKWSGGPYMAVDCGEKVEISAGDNLSVYKSSQWAERVFCKLCGTLIAWRLQEGGENHVSANLFEESRNFDLGMQVFIDEKPANYNFLETTKTMTGPDLFAMFAPPEES